MSRASKYKPLEQFLASRKEPIWTPSLDDIQKLLGTALPASARKHREFWSNERKPRSPQKLAIMNAGWSVQKVDLSRGWLQLVRTTNSRRNISSSPSPGEKPRTNKGVGKPKFVGTTEAAVSLRWVELGTVELDANGKLGFPTVPRTPALYRFRFDHGTNAEFYVGEASNLFRRLGNYRNPGPTQPTNQRIGALMRSQLTAGVSVSVEAVLETAILAFGSKRLNANLENKAQRLLMENAAIVELMVAGQKVLNKSG